MTTHSNPAGSLSRKLLSGSALRLGTLLVAALSAFLLMPLMVHQLGDRLYGFWTLSGALIGYYGLLDLGLSAAVSQYLCIAIGRNEDQESRAIFNTALGIQSLLGCAALLVTAGIALAAPLLCRSPQDAALFWKVIVVLGVNAAVGFPARVYRGLLEAQYRFDIQSGLDFCGVLLRSAAILLAVLLDGGILALAWASLLSALPIMLLQVYFGRREAPWARIDHSLFALKGLRKLFSYSTYTFGTAIADVLRFQIDAFVVSAFVGLAFVTHYRIATVFSNYYINALVEVSGLFAPVMSRLHGAGDRAGLTRVFLFATKVSMSIAVLICGTLIVWGRPFIERWMGVRYEDAYLPMVILSAAVFLDVFQSPSVGLLYATFNHRRYALLNTIEGILNLIFSVMLARPLGLVGVALGTLIAALIIRVFVQPALVCRASGLRYPVYLGFLGFNLLRSLLLMAAIAGMLHWAIRASYAWLAGSSLAAAALFAVGSLFVVFNRVERKQFWRAMIQRNLNSMNADAFVPAP